MKKATTIRKLITLYKRKIYRYTDKVCKEPCGSYHDKYPVYTGTCYRSQPCNKKDV